MRMVRPVPPLERKMKGRRSGVVEPQAAWPVDPDCADVALTLRAAITREIQCKAHTIKNDVRA